MTGSPVDAKISVIVPAYNHERFIVRTLESLTLQTRPADEIIVVNDGSPDDTETAVAPFLNDIDYIRQPNRGVAAALNRGLERATGDYFLFLASDDYLAPHALEVLATTLDGDSQVGVAYGNVTIVDEGGRALGQPFPRGWCRKIGRHDPTLDLIQDNFLAAPATMSRSEAVRCAGGFADFPHSQDWALWLRIALNGWAFFGVDDDVAYYRRHHGNTSRPSNCTPALRDAIRMLEWMAREMERVSAHHANLLRESAAVHRRNLARSSLADGRVAVARATYQLLAGQHRHRAEAICGIAMSYLPPYALRFAVSMAGGREPRSLRI